MGIFDALKAGARELSAAKARREQREREKWHIEQWDLTGYPDISNYRTPRRLSVAGITFHKKELKHVCKFLDYKPSAKEPSRFIPVILRQEANTIASGGVAIGVWYYGIQLGYVKEDDLRRVKQRMEKLSGGADVRADARLMYFDMVSAPAPVWVSYEA